MKKKCNGLVFTVHCILDKRPLSIISTVTLELSLVNSCTGCEKCKELHRLWGDHDDFLSALKNVTATNAFYNFSHGDTVIVSLEDGILNAQVKGNNNE